MWGFGKGVSRNNGNPAERHERLMRFRRLEMPAVGSHPDELIVLIARKTRRARDGRRKGKTDDSHKPFGQKGRFRRIHAPVVPPVANGGGPNPHLKQQPNISTDRHGWGRGRWELNVES